MTTHLREQWRQTREAVEVPDELLSAMEGLVYNYDYPYKPDDPLYLWAVEHAKPWPVLWRGLVRYSEEEREETLQKMRDGWAVSPQFGALLVSATKRRGLALEFTGGGRNDRSILIEMRNAVGVDHEVPNTSGNVEDEVLLVPQRFRYVDEQPVSDISWSVTHVILEHAGSL